jgi:hypothetical protein
MGSVGRVAKEKVKKNCEKRHEREERMKDKNYQLPMALVHENLTKEA